MAGEIASGRSHRVIAIWIGILAASGVAPASAAPIKPAAAPARPAPTKKVPKPAKAPSADEAKRAEARRHYADAEAKFQSGDFEGAYASYKAANDTLAASQTLYKMALCLDKLDKPGEALAAFGAFLSSGPPPAMDAKVSEAQARVTELKKKVPVLVKVKSDPPGALVLIDGVAQQGVSPLEAKVPPGAHKFRVSSSGYEPFDKDLTIEPGARDVTLEAPLQKKAPPVEAPIAATEPVPLEPAPALPAEGRSNTAAYVVLGVAGAGAVVGGIFGIKALQGRSDFNNGERTTDKADQVDRNALIADMALGTAITLGVTGTVLLLTGAGSSEATRRSASSAPLHVVPLLSPRQAGAAATFRF